MNGFSRRRMSALAALAAVSLGGYLWLASRAGGWGFPLDDAWIHQTYARNLAQTGQWAFLPGRPSAGSTGPLWGALLALGPLLRLSPLIWTYILGAAILLGLALLAAALWPELSPEHPARGWMAAGLILLEWHLVWSALSGMETLLFSLLALLALAWLAARRRPGFWLGAIIGLSVWVRPDGVTLLGAVFWSVFWEKGRASEKWRTFGWLLSGFLTVLLPYLLFNFRLDGVVLPNTFYAKQAEYALLREIPLWRRWLQLAAAPLIGGSALLLPGFGYKIWQQMHARDWASLAAPLWALGYLSMYAWRLPVTYQHGRYLMPVLPVLLLWGLAGMLAWARPAAARMGTRVLSRAWLLSFLLVLVLFWGIGGRAYARDVALINTEMVAAAQWVAENLPPDALVAAHDIGALGYFGQHDLLDLAGLVSPEVIPFMRDQPRLKTYLQQQSADVLVAFPSWYSELTAGLPLLWQSDGRVSPQLGGENMAIYCLP